MTRTSVPNFSAVATAIFLVAAFLDAGDGGAQVVPDRGFHGGMNTGIGYSGVLPEVAAGAGAWHFFGSSRIGVFTDAKFTTGSFTGESDYCPDAIEVCTLAWVQQNRPEDPMPPIRDQDEWLLVNAGGMYALSPEFAIMIGGGAARLRRVFELVDWLALEEERPPGAELITPSGRYFVDQEVDPTWQAQLVLGMLFRAGNNLAFRAGYETAPGGMSLGVYFVLP